MRYFKSVATRNVVVLILAGSLALLFVGTVRANEADLSLLGPPTNTTHIDPAGVALQSGTPTFSLDVLRIGNGALSLQHSVSSYSGWFVGLWDNYKFAINSGTNPVTRTIKFGNVSHVFVVPNSNNFERTDAKGARLSYRNGTWTFTSVDGVKVYADSSNPVIGIVTPFETIRVVYPNGFEFTRDSQGLTTNTGLRLMFSYDSLRPLRPNLIQAVNLAHEYCNVTMLPNGCQNYDWPRASFNWLDQGNKRTLTVVDAAGNTSQFKQDTFVDPKQIRHSRLTSKSYNGREFDYQYRLAAFTAGATTPQNYSYVVDKAIVDGITYTYGWTNSSCSNCWGTATINAWMRGPTSRANINAVSGDISYTIALTTERGVTTFQQNSLNNPASMKHEGRQYDFTYRRSNIIEKKQVENTNGEGASIADIVYKANYPTSCTASNYKVCNKPTSVTDAMGSVTMFSYHAASGQLSKIQAAADENGIRPTTFFKYQQYYARYYTSLGTLQRAARPVWLLSEKRVCLTKQASANDCATNDAQVTQYFYGDANSANNLWLTEQVMTNPEGDVRRTCFQYDVYGNQIGVIEPNANLSSCR